EAGGGEAQAEPAHDLREERGVDALAEVDEEVDEEEPSESSLLPRASGDRKPPVEPGSGLRARRDASGGPGPRRRRRRRLPTIARAPAGHLTRGGAGGRIGRRWSEIRTSSTRDPAGGGAPGVAGGARREPDDLSAPPSDAFPLDGPARPRPSRNRWK